jgi:hypothetical protein
LTGDNATNNDKMAEELYVLVDGFAGQASRIRCFLHVINLVAKTILKQFETPKKKAKGNEGDVVGETLDEFENILLELAEGVDLEDSTLLDDDNNDDDGPPIDNVEGWEDEMAQMSDTEREDLERALKPLKLVLAKVNGFDTHLVSLLLTLLTTQAPEAGLYHHQFHHKGCTGLA